MLLRDSEVARQVRVYLLDMEYLSRTQPVDNPAHTGDAVSLDHRIDQRITHILGKTVVPMFDILPKDASQLSSSGGVRSASTFSTRSNSPHTTYR